MAFNLSTFCFASDNAQKLSLVVALLIPGVFCSVHPQKFSSVAHGTARIIIDRDRLNPVATLRSSL